jgi:pimeloyl-ACP methyl ester carboxylesterase
MSVVRVIVFALAALVCGCTGLAEIRTHHGTGTDLPVIDALSPDADCRNGDSTPPSRANSLEDYGDYWSGFVEFDDEGWLFDSNGQPSQIDAFQAKLKEELRTQPDTDFLVVAFAHGWHHNAHDNDCNVHEFRAMLKTASERYAKLYPDPLHHKRRVVGLYVGWRGESLNIEGLRYTTVLDRRNAAERIAKGDVRGLFALLRKLQVAEVRASARADRMRTVVVGHSFGALIAFHGLSPTLLNELELTKPEVGLGCRPVLVRSPANPLTVRAGVVQRTSREADDIALPAFPDLLVLINPAFEGTRFETLHELMRPTGCAYPPARPKLVVVTADNDSATGPIFTAGREVLTVLEKYPPDPLHKAHEKQANTHAIGFIDRYKTHRLCIGPGPSTPRAAAAWEPVARGDWQPDRFAPVWVVGAPAEIVDGHNGFLYAKPDPSTKVQQPYLLNWLIALHAFGVDDQSPALVASCTPVAASR